MMHSTFLPSAPIEEELATPDNRLTDVWKNHMNSITEILGLTVASDRFNDTKQNTPVTIVVAMEEARRNQLENAFDGSIIYNLTTKRFNFRENGAWVTFTPIPA